MKESPMRILLKLSGEALGENGRLLNAGKGRLI